MQQDSFASKEVLYLDPRLGLSVVGRLLVRVITGIVFVLLIAIALLGLLSDIPLFQASSIFALLFLIERFLYRAAPEQSLRVLVTQARPNLALGLTPDAAHIVERAYDAAHLTQQPLALSLLTQLLRDASVMRVLDRTEVERHALVAPTDSTEPLVPAAITEVLAPVVARAADAARGVGADGVSPAALFAGLLSLGNPQIDRIATRAGLTAEDVMYALRAMEMSRLVHQAPRVVPHHTMNRAWTSRPTPALDAVSSDLTDLARLHLLPELVGHSAAYNTLVETLAKPTHPHAILVAPSAGGKETVVGEVARAMVAGAVPPSLFDRRLVRIDIAALLAAGGSDPAHLIKAVADEIVVAGNIVLYVPDFEHLAQGTGAYLAAADIFLPILTADTFPVIAATTPEAYARILETRGDVAGTFQAIRLEALPITETITVLAGAAQELERRYRVVFSVSALRAAATLAARYLAPARPLPGSALDVLGEAAVAASGAKMRSVTAAQVEQIITRQTHIPVGAASKEETDHLLHLEDTLRGRVIGQDEAISGLSEAVRAYRAGLSPDGAPASFLFVGPTGVGKTELAKALADAVYGADAFVRLDMSEFAGPDSIARLIGTTTSLGALTEPVRIAPHRLVLLDELEKAHPEAVRLLLQVASDGRLTDGLGRTVAFGDVLLVATSNAKSEIVREALRQGEGVAGVEGYVRSRLSDVFPTELLNRFTRIIIFRDLNPEQLRTIAQQVVAHIAALLDAKYGVGLQVDGAALTEMVRTGYDPEWGARPLRRVVEAALDSVLAPKLLAGTVARGATVTLTFRDGAYALVD